MAKLGPIRPLLFVILGGLAGACSCGGSPFLSHGAALHLELGSDPSGAADYLLDFGQVLVGSTSIREVKAQNRGTAPLEIDLETNPAPFRLQESPIGIAIGETGNLSFVFSPFMPSDAPIETVITLATNEDGGRLRHTIRLRGQGVLPRLDCEPAALAFGNVRLGRSRSANVSCTNRLETDVEVAAVDLEGSHALAYRVRPLGGLPITLSPGQGLDLEVEFQSESERANSGLLVPVDPRGRQLASVPLTAEGVSTEYVLEPAGCLDFGFVPLGERVEQAFTIRNIGSDEAEVVALTLAEASAGSYSIQTRPPLPLAPGAEGTEVVVEFRPTNPGRHTSTLDLAIRRSPGEIETQSACVTGYGGGSRIECDRERVDYGAVAIGSPVTARLRCTHLAETPEGEAIEPLELLGVASDHPAFVATIRDLDGSLGPRMEGYAEGEGFFVEVTFDPQEETFQEASIVIEGSVAAKEIEAAGEGRLLPPCEFSILPPRVSFGVVERRTSREKRLTIQNHLGTACLIHELELSEDSDPAFSVEPIAHRELGPYEELQIPVRFAPTINGRGISGAIEFWISNPEDPFQRVELRGDAAHPCLLIEPRDLDFGESLIGCPTSGRLVILRNVCDAALSIDSIDLGPWEEADSFYIEHQPALPRLLPPGQGDHLSVVYLPRREGEERTDLSVEVSYPDTGEEELHTALLRGIGTKERMRTDTFEQGEATKVDVLWVIDNSSSMRPFQEILKNNLPAFIGFADMLGINYHLGVTTTGLVPDPYCFAPSFGAENGRLFPVNGTHPRILTPATPDLELHWEHNVVVGACVSTIHAESAMEAAYQALSPPLIHARKDPRNQGTPLDNPYLDGNLGFLRDDAMLSVVLVTDTMDFSPRHNDFYLDFYWGLKAGRREMVKVHGITRPPEGGCANPSLPSDRLLHVVREGGGEWANICESDWTDGLRRISRSAFDIPALFHLHALPVDRGGDGSLDPDDFDVFVDGRRVERSGSWSYDEEENAIRFSYDFIPSSGSTIRISYETGCAGGAP